MDDLRWILAIVGATVVVAIYLSGRFEREEWKRDHENSSEQHRRAVLPELLQEHSQEKFTATIDVHAAAGEGRGPVLQQPVHESTTEPEPGEKIAEEETVSATGFSGPEATIVSQHVHQSEGDWDGAMDSAREPLIEDEIVPIEIPSELAEFGEERRSRSRLKLKPEPAKPFQQELGLNVEPLVLVLTILAKNEASFNGGDIYNALDVENVRHGDMDIFHFHTEAGKDAVFSIASAVEPGTFNLGTMDEYETPGLSLFCQLPGPLESAAAFSILLEKARKIAENLNGKLCDDKRNLLTEQSTAHYRDRIMAFDHELLLARKKLE